MLTNGSHIYFNQMGGLLLLPMKFHINESSMVNIISFVEVTNIAGVHINLDTSKGEKINVHIKYKNIIHFKACAEGRFYTNFIVSSMISNPTNVSLNVYYYISMAKQDSGFY